MQVLTQLRSASGQPGLLQGAGRQTGRTGFQICMSGAEVEWPAAVHAVAARQLR